MQEKFHNSEWQSRGKKEKILIMNKQLISISSYVSISIYETSYNPNRIQYLHDLPPSIYVILNWVRQFKTNIKLGQE